jgi:hypothetical protein
MHSRHDVKATPLINQSWINGQLWQCTPVISATGDTQVRGSQKNVRPYLKNKPKQKGMGAQLKW